MISNSGCTEGRVRLTDSKETNMSELDPKLLQQLDEPSRQEITQFVNQESSKAKIQSSVTNFTNLCFKKCISTIDSNQLSNIESTCVTDCLNRFLDTNIKVVEMYVL